MPHGRRPLLLLLSLLPAAARADDDDTAKPPPAESAPRSPLDILIDDSEKPKLEASFVKVTEVIAAYKGPGKPTLFIAGHTDTVGAAAYNAQLSRARAQSIASWFRHRGLKIGIAFEGFGESALLVK